jgi:2-hydroxymuconate-semialdehyde hydrolase
MTEFIPWDSQPLDMWAEKHAPGSFVELDGHRTHYVTKGDGPPVLLVHGFNYDINTWSANIDAIAEHFTVFAVDLWGAGYSTRQPLDYCYPLFTDQICRFMDHLKIERALLVGHSMGGGTSIFTAVNHHHRIDRLVLVDSVGIPRHLPLRGRLFMLPLIPELMLGLNTNAVRRKNLLDYWIHNQDLLTDEVFEEMTRYQKIEGTTRAALYILRKNFFNTLDIEIRTLAGLGIPTLIVWGRHDHSVPLESGTEMHDILKGSRLEVFNNAGHLANFDQAEDFNRIVIRFLTGDG